jgi:hypothetical protein
MSRRIMTTAGEDASGSGGRIDNMAGSIGFVAMHGNPRFQSRIDTDRGGVANSPAIRSVTP